MIRKLFIVMILAVSAAAHGAAAPDHNDTQASDSLKVLDEFGAIQCEDYLARMDSAIIQAQNNPSGKVLVIVYDGKLAMHRYDRKGKMTTYFANPPVGNAKGIILSMKKYLKLRGDPKNFVFVEGGPREEFLVKLYLVPEGVALPQPAPTKEKIKYGKGKP